MKTLAAVNRRSVLGSLSISTFLAATALPVKASPADARIIELGHEFNSLAAQIDHAIETRLDVSMDILEQFSRVGAEILTIQAKTIDGLRVKARAACWALLGDLDPANNMTLDKSMALSIVRDLIRVHDPSLEHPGALKILVEDATNSASHSVARLPTN
jgi:hypothetical protein